jgi:hypothetical protein
MYLGPFYFDTKEIFLILAAIFIGIAMILNLPLYWFDQQALLLLVILILITKGLLPSIHNEAFFIIALICIFATLYFNIFQIVIFYFLSFAFFRLFRVI